MIILFDLSGSKYTGVTPIYPNTGSSSKDTVVSSPNDLTLVVMFSLVFLIFGILLGYFLGRRRSSLSSRLNDPLL